MSEGGLIPAMVGMLAKTTAVIAGGLIAASAVTAQIARRNAAKNWEKWERPCGVCKQKGFYRCKLCKGKGTIEWSPMYDPVHINPCLCPTCDGYKVQKCLNCLGLGYIARPEF
ncbi:hypothetical protein M9H77_34923 [Catharanthus roseus]|uniref:Uncharacterized protein n=1 Tax=Catharanthus roseus TaxID=4058 RepID=A0ACB9ZMU3_CATRO|nr:hypothetical protein M9H77_34923 [Catharanthus roseus]